MAEDKKKKKPTEETAETLKDEQQDIKEKQTDNAEQPSEESKKDPEEKAEEKTESEEPETKESEETPEEQESERYMRLMAEFQNFKKRAAKEKTDIHAYANEKLMNELLPVLDNFERALETKTEEVESYAKGMELIFSQMKTALENHGLKEIEALGEDFDPNKHNAVMNEDSEEYESGKVCKVLQKGYELNGKVIRPAMVAVSQ